MDIDVLRVSGKSEWKRLEELTHARTLSGPEIDELDRLYRSATTDLARVRTHSPDPDLIAELSRILSAARGRLAGTGGLTGRGIARFFMVSLPVTLYRIRWVIVGVMAVFIALCVIQAHYLMTTPAAMNELGTPEQLRRYAQEDFVWYYSQDTHSEFAMSVWANNSWVSLQGIATGISGVYPLYLLWGNAMALGTSGAVVIEYASTWHFFRFILRGGSSGLLGARRAGGCDPVPGCRTGGACLDHGCGGVRDPPGGFGHSGGFRDAFGAARRREDLARRGVDGSHMGLHFDPGPTRRPGWCQR